MGHPLIVHADYYQYYAYAAGGDFDQPPLDAANDGIMAPGSDAIRIDTGAHYGEVELTVTVTDRPIRAPDGDEVVASACNLDLPEGIVTINDFDGSEVFAHDFGQPLRCGFLVQVHDRDAANAANYTAGPHIRERHAITISSRAFQVERWRTRTLDAVGASLEVFTDHVGIDLPPADEHADRDVALGIDLDTCEGDWVSEGPSAHPR